MQRPSSWLNRRRGVSVCAVLVPLSFFFFHILATDFFIQNEWGKKEKLLQQTLVCSVCWWSKCCSWGLLNFFFLRLRDCEFSYQWSFHVLVGVLEDHHHHHHHHHHPWETETKMRENLKTNGLFVDFLLLQCIKPLYGAVGRSAHTWSNNPQRAQKSRYIIIGVCGIQWEKERQRAVTMWILLLSVNFSSSSSTDSAQNWGQRIVFFYTRCRWPEA